jgi:hypothetical protein
MAESAKIDAAMATKGEQDSRRSPRLSGSGVRFARIISARVIVNELLICSARP